ncbi:MAG: branched-chain amino acid transaminase [Chloroflexi bacterium]|nr:branched-chain amino acid transaminase [Chloroflexota bacterium]
MVEQPELPVWFDGAFVPLSQATVGVHSAAITQGAAVFEGIRGYWNPDDKQTYIFHLAEHMQRLQRSMRLLRIELPYPLTDIGQACVETIARAQLHGDCYLRPTVFIDEEEQLFGDLPPFRGRAWVTVASRFKRAPLDHGLRAGVSSWRRITDQAMPPRVKANANYFNSRLAQVQAHVDGYDQAIILNERGNVSELPGACLMMVRDSVIITPPVSDNILESITRATILELCQNERLFPIIERSIDRSELYTADEIFACGTGMEIRPVTSVDHIPVGSGIRGPITEALQERYFAIARGQDPHWSSWLTPVYPVTASVK